ncbi:hypothetical protein [Pseudoxanthomonas sp.]|uniref:hypothetical protein n=1 Tax=Pseudoxanthomonas sp. TaxID=1871049 RepID=UPI003F81EF47
MRPTAAWLAVLAALCLLLSTVHLGAITGDKPHGFGHWQPHLQPSASEDGAPKDDHHDDLPAKKRRVQMQVVTRQAEPMPAPASLLPLHAVAPVLQDESSLAQGPPRVSDQWPTRPPPPRQRHRGQAPPALHC